jgi:hypothetical protein
MTRLALPVLAALLLTACGPRLLPGSDIHDTRDTRAIANLVQSYRQALEQRDASAVLALVSPDYFDTAGTTGPEDDVDRAELERRLPADLAKVEAIRLELTLRKIDVEGDRAEAELFYDGWYKVKTPSGTVPRRDTDVHRMRLRKVAGQWRIASGL